MAGPSQVAGNLLTAWAARLLASTLAMLRRQLRAESGREVDQDSGGLTVSVLMLARMDGGHADSLWDAFVANMLATSKAHERRSRYRRKPAVCIEGREVAHLEAPGIIDRDPSRRDWIELHPHSLQDLQRPGWPAGRGDRRECVIRQRYVRTFGLQLPDLSYAEAVDEQQGRGEDHRSDGSNNHRIDGVVGTLSEPERPDENRICGYKRRKRHNQQGQPHGALLLGSARWRQRHGRSVALCVAALPDATASIRPPFIGSLLRLGSSLICVMAIGKLALYRLNAR